MNTNHGLKKGTTALIQDAERVQRTLEEMQARYDLELKRLQDRCYDLERKVAKLEDGSCSGPW